MRRPLLFLFALAVGACAAAEEKDEIKLDDPRPRYKQQKTDEWYIEQIATAEEELKGEEYERALGRVYRALATDPNPEAEALLKEILGRLNQQVLEMDTVVAWIDPVKDPIAFNEEVRVRIHIKNSGSRPVSIPAKLKGASASKFELDIIRRDYNMKAQVVETRKRVYRDLPEDLSIPPGGSTEVVLKVPRTGNSHPLNGFRIIVIGGRLRASVIEMGGLRRWDAVKMTPGALHSFRPNYEHLQDDPFHRVQQALDLDAPVHLLTAAALVPFEKRRETVDVLIAGFGKGQRMDFAVLASLQYLTGITELGPDPSAWRSWWPRVREDFFRPARKIDRSKPAFEK